MRRGGEAAGALSAKRGAVCARRLGMAALVAGVLAMASAPLANAQTRPEDALLDTIVTNTEGQPPVAATSDKPMLLQADELVYDNANNRVVARGNVEIYYNNYALTADEVIYDRAANTLAASGSVRIKEPSGSIISADQITLTEDFRDGFIGSLQITTQDDVRIAAETATRQDGETTVFERGIFTPCKACVKQPNAPPFWRLRAAKIIHKKSEGNLYFEDVSFDILGQPIVYVPFFYAPDPSVKRRSGFLVPNIVVSESLGLTSEVPYFWAIAPNMDFTFSPMTSTTKGVLVKGLWRHRLANGEYFVDLAGIDEWDADGELRGSVKTKGEFALNNWWNFGWDGTLESDTSFRRFYGLDSALQTDRLSNIHLVGQSARNYFGAFAYHATGLKKEDATQVESTAWAVPEIDYHYVFDMPLVGGEFSFDANALSLQRGTFNAADATRLTGTQHNRIVAEAKWRKQIIDPLGQVFTPFATARADIYQLEDLVGVGPGVVEPSRVVTRSTGTIGMQYQFPFAARTGNVTHVLEPVGQVLVRPNTLTNDAIPIEDAQSLVFDDTLLFDLDKFSGYDRIETGTRANVGLQYTLQDDSGGFVRAVGGRSYHLSGDNPFETGTGLDSDASDYVVGLYMAPTSNFEFVAQSRFDASSLRLVREDLSAAFRAGPLAMAVNYALDISSDQTGKEINQKEIQASGSLKLSENWTALAALRYDIDESQVISDSLGLKWNNDCTSLSIIYSDTRISDQDIEPNQSLVFRLELDYLGATTVPIDNLGNLAVSNK